MKNEKKRGKKEKGRRRQETELENANKKEGRVEKEREDGRRAKEEKRK